MKTNISIGIDEKALQRLMEKPAKLKKAVEIGIKKVTKKVFDDVQKDAPSQISITKATAEHMGAIYTKKWQWVFFEYGAAPHTVVRRTKKVLAAGMGGEIFGTTMEHPGLPKKPFVRKNVEGNKKEAKDIIFREIEKIWPT